MRKKYFFSWIVVFLLCLPVVGRAQVKIDTINFPDEHFRAYVSAMYDKDKSGSLEPVEYNQVLSIDLSVYKNLENLKGIETFWRLQSLDCSNTGITSLDVSQNRDLQSLDCSNTGITSLDVSQNRALQSLDCSNTGITGLDVSQNRALQSLDCSHTGIVDLELWWCEALESLDCSHTGIVNLDLRGCEALESLDCSYTGITSLDRSLLQNLRILDCSYTEITSLDPRRCSILTDLDCSNTRIRSLDVFQNRELKSLVCSDTEITSLDLRVNDMMTYLECSNSGREVAAEVGGTYDLARLPDFDVSRTRDWEGGSVEGSVLTFHDTVVTYSYATQKREHSHAPDYVTFRLEANPDLIARPVEFSPVSGTLVKKGDIIRLSCANELAVIYYGLGKDAEPTLEYNPEEGIVISQDTTYVTARSVMEGEDVSEVTTAIYQVHLIPVDEEYFPDPVFREYVSENIDKDKSGALNEEECAAVTHMELSSNPNLNSLKGIEYFPNLRSLNVSNTGIRSLDVSQHIDLQSLDCSGTELTSLDLSQSPDLEVLSCSNSGREVAAEEEGTYDLSRLPGFDVSRTRDWQGGSVEGTILTFQGKTVTYSYATGYAGERDIPDHVTFSLVANPTLIARPVVFSPASGTMVKKGDTIRLSCATEGATIYYGMGEDAEPVQEYDSETLIIASQNPTHVTARSILAGEDTSEVVNAVYQVYLFSIDENHFPDPVFRQYVSDYIDTDQSGTINEEECSLVTDIRIEDNNLRSLEGIEYFPFLEFLRFPGTGVDRLDLSRNPLLHWVDCSNTVMDTLDISKSPALKTLMCYDTEITNLDVSQNPLLEWLEFSGTDIQTIDVSNNTALKNLRCSHTGITTLDLSQNPELRELQCSYTKIDSLDLSHNPQLGWLLCDNTKIKSLDLSHNPYLTELDCSETMITSLDLSQNSNLGHFKCEGSHREVAAEIGGTYNLSRLPGFDVSRASDWKGGSVKGEILTFYGTSVTYRYTTLFSGDNSSVPDALSFRLMANPKLIAKPVEFVPDSGSIVRKGDTIRLRCATEGASIYYGLGKNVEPMLEYNPKEGIVVSQDTTYVTARSIMAGEDTSEVTSAVYQVYLIPVDEEHFPDSVFRKYVSDNIDMDKSGALNEEEYTAVTYVELSSIPNLTSLKGIEHFPNLNHLDCSNTGIGNLDVSRNTKLQILYCFNTEIGSLDVSQNPDLLELKCTNTALADLDLSQNQKLSQIECSNTGIMSLDLSRNPDLIALYCSNTEITKLDVSRNPELVTLYCSSTGIETLDLSQNPGLTELECSNTEITSLDVSQNPKLSFLSCSNTKLTSLDISRNPEIRMLYCDNLGREVAAEDGGSYDLSRLPEFDVSRSSEWQGGSVEGTTLTFQGKTVTYRYATGYTGENDVPDYVAFRLVANSALIARPVEFNPASGSIVKLGDTIRLSCASEGSVIYYGLGEESEPDQEYKPAEGIIITADTTHIRALAMIPGHDTSAVVSATYFRRLVVEPEFSPASGSIVKKGDTIRLSCASEGSVIYYGLGKEAEPDQEYKSAEGIVITADTTHVRALAMIPSHDTSEIVSAVYYVKIEDPDPEPDTVQVVLPSGLEARVEGDTVTLGWKSEENYIYQVKVEGPGEQDSLTKEVASAGERTECRFTKLEKGTYRWSVRVIRVGETDTISTYVEGEEFKIGEVSSRKEELAGLRIYPNPTSGSFMVEVKEPVRLDIYTATGLRVKSLELEAGTESLELKVSGLYLMRFTAADGRSEYQRLVVR